MGRFPGRNGNNSLVGNFVPSKFCLKPRQSFDVAEFVVLHIISTHRILAQHVREHKSDAYPERDPRRLIVVYIAISTDLRLFHNSRQQGVHVLL